jgi:SAM-dependent methyltransferase
MKEYWESRFSSEGAMWQFEPSDSALTALDFFKTRGIKKILIPGFGYGRNAKLFIDNGFEVTGIEISGSAIQLAKQSGISCKIHHGSVTSMPFDKEKYSGIFCYALVHLLNKPERRNFLKACYNQVTPGGYMVFTLASKQMSMYGSGTKLGRNRFRIPGGLEVFFYDQESVWEEFSDFGITEFHDITEPIKFAPEQEPIKLIFVICQKKKEL